MKAATYRSYGPPEVIRFEDLEKPIANENELLIKIYASTVNRTDVGFRSAQYVISRFWTGLFKPKHPILGCEFSGVVEAIGSKVTQFKPGDAVFGYNDVSCGGCAEYICMPEDAAVVHKPDTIDIYDAAAMSEGSHYALSNITASKIKAGDQALVYGATGAIGTAAVQLLKSMDIWVTAVCNTKNRELVKSLGADEVIDYQTQDFTQTHLRFDAIFDAVGKSSFWKCKPLLKPKGVYISTELGKRSENVFLALITPLLGKKKVLFPIPSTKRSDLLYFRELCQNGKFKPVIDSYYDFDQIIEAHRYVESGQKTGNLIIRIYNTGISS